MTHYLNPSSGTEAPPENFNIILTFSVPPSRKKSKRVPRLSYPTSALPISSSVFQSNEASLRSTSSRALFEARHARIRGLARFDLLLEDRPEGDHSGGGRRRQAHLSREIAAFVRGQRRGDGAQHRCHDYISSVMPRCSVIKQFRQNPVVIRDTSSGNLLMAQQLRAFNKLKIVTITGCRLRDVCFSTFKTWIVQ